MSTKNYITTSCAISKNEVLKNGLKVFENEGELSVYLLSVYHHFQFNYPKFYKMDNLSKLGWLCSELLLKDKYLAKEYYPKEIGVVLTNSSSSLDNDLKYYNTLKDIPSPSLFVYTLPNIVIGEICIRNNFKGEHAFFIQDAFDAAFVGQQVNYYLDKDILQACICGWVEVIGQHYKAVLFLVEKKENENAVLFSAENMNSIFLLS